RRNTLVRSSLSSCRASPRAGSAFVAAMGGIFSRSSSRRGRRAIARLPDLLPCAGLGELDDLVDVAGVDETWTGHQDIVGDGVAVALVERQQHDRQIALKVLLLVDREEHRAVLDALKHFGREV